MATGKYAYWLTPEGVARLEDMAARLIDSEMAREMGISSSTYYEWLKKYPEISDAVTRARAGADARANNERVERSLLEAALGGIRTLKKPMKIKKTTYDRGKRVDKETIVYAEEEVYIRPDVKAQIFWLTNRDKERWRQKIEASIDTGDTGLRFEFVGASNEEAAEYAE